MKIFNNLVVVVVVVSPIATFIIRFILDLVYTSLTCIHTHIYIYTPSPLRMV